VDYLLASGPTNGWHRHRRKHRNLPSSSSKKKLCRNHINKRLLLYHQFLFFDNIAAMLQAIQQIQGDSRKVHYLWNHQEMLHQTSGMERCDIIHNIHRDSYKMEAMLIIQPIVWFDIDGLIRCIKDISSDSYKVKALKAVTSIRAFPVQQIMSILTNISADGYKVEAIRHMISSANTVNDIAPILNTMHSDAYKLEALRVMSTPVTGIFTKDMLTEIFLGIQNDGYRARAIDLLIMQMPMPLTRKDFDYLFRNPAYRGYTVAAPTQPPQFNFHGINFTVSSGTPYVNGQPVTDNAAIARDGGIAFGGSNNTFTFWESDDDDDGDGADRPTRSPVAPPVAPSVAPSVFPTSAELNADVVKLDDETRSCRICFTNQPNWILMDCMHACCGPCVDEWHQRHAKFTCPMCRANPHSIKKFFL
jgi:hypothetical protein